MENYNKEKEILENQKNNNKRENKRKDNKKIEEERKKQEQIRSERDEKRKRDYEERRRREDERRSKEEEDRRRREDDERRRREDDERRRKEDEERRRRENEMRQIEINNITETKVENTCEIIFTFKGLDTLIQCQNGEKVNDAINRFIQKIDIDINSIYLIYGGSVVNKELTINELIKSSDKNENKINLLVFNKEEEKENLDNINEGLVKSKIIICPKCHENFLIKIKDYKFSLYGCKNNDITENILLEEFDKTQNINNLKIICKNSSCNTNRNSTYKNKFFKCLTCNINLCPLCNSNHNNSCNN